MPDFEQKIDHLLSMPVYGLDPAERLPLLFELLREEIAYASSRNAAYRNYVQHWPHDLGSARRIADLPFLPVGVFKANPPFCLVELSEVKKTLASSTTTGQQPSRVVLDASTARRMTKGVVAIVQSLIGPTRRPYLVVDTAENLGGSQFLGARGAAIQSLRPFATEMVSCLTADQGGDLHLDLERLLCFAEERRDRPILVYGFTYILWNHLVQPLLAAHICLRMPNVHILHSGGWKRLQDQAVAKETFNEGLAEVFGCTRCCVIDFYGMVESVGIIYPDCEEGNKHVPTFGEVIVRSPLTLDPVAAGEQGLVQVCSALPTSFPGYLLLTDDMAEVQGEDGCPCGRRGMYFRFVGRAPKAEIRGCGNVLSHRP